MQHKNTTPQDGKSEEFIRSAREEVDLIEDRVLAATTEAELHEIRTECRSDIQRMFVDFVVGLREWQAAEDGRLQ